MQKKLLPVGLSNFKEVVTGSYYYVDKTHFLKEIIDSGDRIMLIPRPRRFGKTLNMSMLAYFYACGPITRLKDKPYALPPDKHPRRFDYSQLFSGLAIQTAGSIYQEKMAQHPVIFLSFKDIKDSSWDSCLDNIKTLIQSLYLLHDYLLESPELKPAEKNCFQSIIDLKASTNDFAQSLKYLLLFLTSHYDRQAVILLDEYDMPVLAGYHNNYYQEIIDFLRIFLSSALEDTDQYLEKAVITGILRITKESIFSGLNNLGVYTLLTPEFNTCFGFTEVEVKTMLQDFGLLHMLESVQSWYNGYYFGDTVIYNPWSIINYFNSKDKKFRPYWLNTSDNALIKKLLSKEGKELKGELETLYKGESIQKVIDPHIVLPDIEKRDDLLWGFLLMTGYLKYTAENPDVTGRKLQYTLSIPNEEVAIYYSNIIDSYFSDKIGNEKLELLLQSLLEGDIKQFERFFAELVQSVFSFHDLSKEPERVYHAFVAGLLVWLGNGYEISSNRESGYGRYDIVIIPKESHKIGYVIEFKKVDKEEKETMESALESALNQIADKQYAKILRDRGITHIIEMAIIFSGKKIKIKSK